MNDIDVHEHYRSVEISKLREAMRYGPKQYKEDWDTAIALAKLMGLHGPLEGQEAQLESIFNRILSYQANNPDALPWEQS